MASLSRHHIKYVLGIDIPLNESYQLNESQYRQIIEAQLLYESFLDSIKKVVSDKIGKFQEWKDILMTMIKVLSNQDTVKSFSDIYWKRFKTNTKGLFINALNKLGLSKLSEKFEILVDKITSLQGWKKFMAATAIGSIVTYVLKNIKKFPADQLKNYVSSYLTDNVISDILGKLTDINSYLGWLSPIIKGAEIFYDSIKDILGSSFKAFQMSNAEYINSLKSKINELKISIDQLMKGVDTEMEHTKKPSKALKIAIDHFKEDPKYYDKLKKAGLEEEEMIRCKNCAHRWKESEGGEDKYFCHKCGTNNMPMENLNEGEFCPQCLAQYIRDHINTLEEAEYKGRKVQLGVPMAGDIKKFKVYVKNDKGNVVKVNFGQKGVKIKKNNPERRKSFRARHHCDTNPGPRWKARYWSCRKW